MTLFLWGASATASAVIAMFFAKFYRRSRDRLLLMFALAFATLSLHWTALALVEPREDLRHHFFLLRLLAFVFILVGIADKNRSRRG